MIAYSLFVTFNEKPFKYFIQKQWSLNDKLQKAINEKLNVLYYILLIFLYIKLYVNIFTNTNINCSTEKLIFTTAVVNKEVQIVNVFWIRIKYVQSKCLKVKTIKYLCSNQ